MRKFIFATTIVALLSGCANLGGYTTPTATAVTPPVPELQKWCQAYTATSTTPERALGPVFIKDYGTHFEITNREGSVTTISPVLTIRTETAIQGYDSSRLLFSKGTGKFTGFYGVFNNTPNASSSVYMSCR